MISSLWFFSPQNTIYGVGVGVGEAIGGPRGRGGAPTLVERWWAPWPSSFVGIFHILLKVAPWSFRSFREHLFLHINNTMVILLKITSVRVSSIQIMQVRVQKRAKVFGKVDTTETYHASPWSCMCVWFFEITTFPNSGIRARFMRRCYMHE